MKKLLLLCFVLLQNIIFVSAANSVTIANISTGIDGTSNLIPFGSIDDTWLLTDAPTGVTTGSAIVTSPARPSFFELEPNARWISGSESLGTSDAPFGLYTYQATFDASGYANLAIDGQFGSDNRLIDVRINGLLAIEGPNKYGPCGSTGCVEFDSPISFLIDDPSLFVNGLNTIEFIIENQGPTSDNPTSFILNATVSGSAVPLPPALWLFVSGLLGLIGVARKKAVCEQQTP